MYHVPSLSANLLSVYQLTQTSKVVKYWSNRFFFKDMKNDRLIFIEGFLDSKD